MVIICLVVWLLFDAPPIEPWNDWSVALGVCALLDYTSARSLRRAARTVGRGYQPQTSRPEPTRAPPGPSGVSPSADGGR